FCANCFQIAIEFWRERAQLRRRLCRSLLNNSKRVLAQKWWPAGEKVKQDRAETVNVRRWCELRSRSVCLFGRDIPGCAKNRERVRKVARGVEPFGQSEIAHQRFAAPVEQNVS